MAGRRMVGLVCALGLTLTVSCQKNPGLSETNSSPERAYIRIPAKLVTASFIDRTGFIRDHKWDEQYAFGYVRREVLDQFPQPMFSRVVELDARSWARHRFDAKTLTLLDPPARDDAKGEGYHDYQELTAELENLSRQYPQLTQLSSAGQSVDGRELWLLKISDHASDDENEPKALYIANMHGDETVGRELMVDLAQHLLREYGRSPRLTSLVDNTQIYLMPSMNPDGFEAGRRWNANGYDLNRNFPDFTSDPDDDPAGRQPETQAVMALHAQHHFVMALNFHGGALCFNMPWDTRPNRRRESRFGDDPLLSHAGRTYADQNPDMRENDRGPFDDGVTYGYEWYEVDGGMQDWANYYRRSIHATVELSRTKYPRADELPVFWEENRESLIRYLEEARHGVHLKVTGPQGEPVSPVTVKVDTAPREVTYRNPVIHKPALPGTEVVTVAAEGYETQRIQVEPKSFAGRLTKVSLQPKR